MYKKLHFLFFKRTCYANVLHVTCFISFKKRLVSSFINELHRVENIGWVYNLNVLFLLIAEKGKELCISFPKQVSKIINVNLFCLREKY